MRMRNAVAALFSTCSALPPDATFARARKQAGTLLLQSFTSGNETKILHRLAALMLLWKERPHRFVNDAAFFTACIRHVRQCGRLYDREGWSPTRKLTVRRFKQQLPPRVVAFAWEHASEALSSLLTLLVHIATQHDRIHTAEAQLMAAVDGEVRERLDRRLSQVREALKFYRAVKQGFSSKPLPKGVTLTE